MLAQAQIETEEKKEGITAYCPVCKKPTLHKSCFFDAFYCTICKVVRLLRR